MHLSKKIRDIFGFDLLNKYIAVHEDDTSFGASVFNRNGRTLYNKTNTMRNNEKNDRDSNQSGLYLKPEKLPVSKLKDINHVRWNFLLEILNNRSDFLRCLKAPLTVLDNAIQFIENDAGLSAQSKKVLSAVNRELRNMENLAAYFRLAFTDEINFAQTDLNSLIDKEIARLSKSFRSKRISVKLLPVEFPVLKMDSELLGIAFRNILRNVLEFGQKSTELIIEGRISTGKSENKVIIEFTHPVEKAVPHIIQNAGTMYYSSNNSNMGIGLNLCREVLKIFGGTISLEILSGPSIRTIITLPV